MEVGFKIGHDENVIKELRETIMQVICAPAGDNVKEAALRALTKSLAIRDMSPNHCHVQGDTTHTHHHYPEPEKQHEDYEDEGA